MILYGEKLLIDEETGEILKTTEKVRTKDW